VEPTSILSKFSLTELYDSFIEFLSFYIKPKRYFSRFFLKPPERQFQQTFLLFIFFSILAFLFMDEVSYRKLLSVLFLDVITSIIFASIVYLSVNITSLFKIKNVKFPKVFLFALHSKFLIGPIYFISYIIFIKSELYEFYFICNLFFVIQLYFSLFFFSFFVYRRVRKIIVSILVTILLFNIFTVGLTKITFDNRLQEIFSKLYSDAIYTEFESVIMNQIPFKKYPTHKILYVYEKYPTDRILITSTLKDSISNGSVLSTKNYISEVELLLTKIDSVKPNLKYERSKKGILLWESYLKEISNYYKEETEINKSTILSYVKHLEKDGNLFYHEITFKQNDKFVSKYYEAIIYDYDLIHLSNKSESILILLYPIMILSYFFT